MISLSQNKSIKFGWQLSTEKSRRKKQLISSWSCDYWPRVSFQLNLLLELTYLFSQWNFKKNGFGGEVTKSSRKWRSIFKLIGGRRWIKKPEKILLGNSSGVRLAIQEKKNGTIESFFPKKTLASWLFAFPAYELWRESERLNAKWCESDVEQLQRCQRISVAVGSARWAACVIRRRGRGTGEEGRKATVICECEERRWFQESRMCVCEVISVSLRWCATRRVVL